MEITGRLTADATVATTKSEKQVVNFSIAINDSYRNKDTGEVKETTTYVNCSYWLSPKSASWLKKGALVELFGRIGMNVYNNMDGKAIGALTFHVNSIKLLAFAKNRQEAETLSESNTAATAQGNNPPVVDDLPF